MQRIEMKRMSGWLFVWSWLAVASCQGPGAPAAPAQDAGKHTAGRLLPDEARERVPYHFRELTREALVSVTPDLSGAALRAEEDPLTRRLGLWLDAIHARLLALHPELASVPRPRALLTKRPYANAAVTRVPSCFPVALDLSAVNPWSDSDTRFLDVDRYQPSARSMTDDFACLPLSAPADTLPKLVSWLVAAFPEPCRYTLSPGGGNASPSMKVEECPGLAGAYARSARNLAFTQLTPFLLVEDGLLRPQRAADASWQMTEPEIVGVLAHELGHYYRAHLTRPATDYNYFYAQGAANPATRPAADPALLDLGQRVMEAANKLLSPQRIEGTRYQPLTVLVLKDLYVSDKYFVTELAPLCKKASADAAGCKASCTALADLMQGWDFLYSLPDRIRRGEMGDRELELFRGFDTRAFACLSKLPFARLGPWNAPKLVDEINALQLVTLDSAPLAAAKDLDGFFRGLSDRALELIQAANRRHDAVFQQAIDLRLGYYTAEQEADEISAEIFAALGLDPEILVGLALKQAELDEADGITRGYGEPSAAQCRALAQQGFPEFVGVGRYLDIHHAPCFRAYDLHRELTAHEETFRGLRQRASPVVTGPEKWEVILEQNP